MCVLTNKQKNFRRIFCGNYGNLQNNNLIFILQQQKIELEHRNELASAKQKIIDKTVNVQQRRQITV